MFRSSLFIIATFAFAITFNILPVPAWAVWFRPEWAVLVLAYWVIVLPNRVSVGIAWSIGLLLDVLYGSLLGEHALAMSTAVYLLQRMYYQIRVFPMWQQALMIGLISLVYQTIVLIVQGIIGYMGHPTWYWLPAISSFILWPWVFVILTDMRRRFRVV